MLKHNIITAITVAVILAPNNCNSKMAKSVCARRLNGYEIFNPIFVFLITYKFTAFIMKLMFGILK